MALRSPRTVYFRRPYSGPADLLDIAELLRLCRAANRTDRVPGLKDVRRGVVALPADDCGMWYDEHARLCALAQLNARDGSLWLSASPEAGSALESEMVAWGIARMAQAGRQLGRHVELSCRVREDNGALIAALTEFGFQSNPNLLLRMARALQEPITLPGIPAGFAIRPIAGEQEAEALVAMHREAFQADNMTVEERLWLMRDPAYLPELDLVAVAPDGELAAFCLGWFDRQENPLEGTTDPVGTRPAFRRMGLAHALLLNACQRLKVHGAETASLLTGSWNVAAQATFQAAGYRTIYRVLKYERVIGL